MTARFVLDEWSWTKAAGAGRDALPSAVRRLLDRLDVARERGEGVVRHRDYYETDLGDNVRLYSVLFEQDCSLKFDHDLTERLLLALDRINEFDDSGLVEYDIKYGGSVLFAPGVAWAHACCSQRRHVAVLLLPLDGVPSGTVSVAVQGVATDVMFVTDENQHVEFFRTVIELENADEAMFEHLSASAFPELEWADDVWRGLRDFSRPYVNIRTELVRVLGGLNDRGAACFRKYGAGDPQELSNVISTQVGAETSDENGRTKSYRPSARDRTRRYRGDDMVFWWHVKLQRHVDRVYFRYVPPSKDLPWSKQDCIVIGILKDHCVLPG